MDTDLTSLYKTTTYHNDGRITSREHRDFDFLKITNAYVVGAIMIAIVTVAIPFLILLPLMYYIIHPIRILKKTNPDFEDNLLKNSGFNKLSDFHLAVKIKTILLIGVLLVFAIVVNYFVLTEFNKSIFDMLELQLIYSKYLFALYFIIPFFITRERVIVKVLTKTKNFNLIEKLYINKSRTADNPIKENIIKPIYISFIKQIFIGYIYTCIFLLFVLMIFTYNFEIQMNIGFFIYDNFKEIALPSIISDETISSLFDEFSNLGFFNIYTIINKSFHFFALVTYPLLISIYYLIKFFILLNRNHKTRKVTKILSPILLLSIVTYYHYINETVIYKKVTNFFENDTIVNIDPRHFEFYDAIHKRKLGIIEKLVKEGFNVNYKNEKGITPLIFAAGAFYQDKKIIEFLVNNGANVNDFDNSGKSVLIAAVDRGNIDVVKYLIGKGVDINFKDDDRRESALKIAMNSISYYPELKDKVLNKTYIEIAKLLINSGADGSSIVKDVVILNNLELLKLLISKNVNLNVKDFSGATPLSYSNTKTAVSREIKKILTKNGAVY